jgi:hypothetical protein
MGSIAVSTVSAAVPKIPFNNERRENMPLPLFSAFFREPDDRVAVGFPIAPERREPARLRFSHSRNWPRALRSDRQTDDAPHGAVRP